MLNIQCLFLNCYLIVRIYIVFLIISKKKANMNIIDISSNNMLIFYVVLDFEVLMIFRMKYKKLIFNNLRFIQTL